jgi:hypothetical protein
VQYAEVVEVELWVGLLALLIHLVELGDLVRLRNLKAGLVGLRRRSL